MSKTVFILDDDPIHRAVVSLMISKVDANVIIHHCENGLVGLNQVKDKVTLDSEAIILVDINMPVLDGWGFLSELESEEMLSDNLRIFILSSSIDDSDVVRARRYPFIEHFYHKPLSNQNIEDLLNPK